MSDQFLFMLSLRLGLGRVRWTFFYFDSIANRFSDKHSARITRAKWRRWRRCGIKMRQSTAHMTVLFSSIQQPKKLYSANLYISLIFSGVLWSLVSRYYRFSTTNIRPEIIQPPCIHPPHSSLCWSLPPAQHQLPAPTAKQSPLSSPTVAAMSPTLLSRA